MRRELFRDIRPVLRRREYVAARNVDFVGQDERDRHARDGLIEIAIHGDDALDRALAARLRDRNGTSFGDASTDDGARKAAEVEIGPVDPLDREAKRFADEISVDIDALKIAEQ